MYKTKSKLVVALYPNKIGFGYCVMENPRKLIDYGSIKITPINNKKVMFRIKKLVDFMLPSFIILQNPNGKHNRTGKRTQRLIGTTKQYAKENNLKLVQYSRDDIRNVFEQFGKKSKYEISHFLVTEFKELKVRAPKIRKVWEGEEHRMAVFDALSLAITHYYLNE